MRPKRLSSGNFFGKKGLRRSSFALKKGEEGAHRIAMKPKTADPAGKRRHLTRIYHHYSRESVARRKGKEGGGPHSVEEGLNTSDA